ncbi:MAG: hydrogenase maturation protease [Rhodocyclaceae bacterium]|nr:hydrogenase maturation protease [Rhodocyclaceae bacterium]
MSASVAPFVVLACGNPSRGDDALGPLLLARLDGWLRAEGVAGHFELIEDFQFQVEHALDLQGRAAALFIDAGEGTPAPFTLRPAQPDDALGHGTHAIPPAAVLAVYRRVVGGEPPPTSVLCVRGEHFALGEGLSPAAAAHLEAAWPRLQTFCHDLLRAMVREL